MPPTPTTIEARYLSNPAWRASLLPKLTELLVEFDLALLKRLYDLFRLQAIDSHRFTEFTLWTGPRFMPKNYGDEFAHRFTVRMQFSSAGNCTCVVNFYPGDQMEKAITDPVRGNAIAYLCGAQNFITLWDIVRWEEGKTQAFNWQAWQEQQPPHAA